MTEQKDSVYEGAAAERPEPGSAETRDRSHLVQIGWGESKDKYRMDSNKLNWHLDRVKQWVGPDFEFSGQIAPLHIDMGITTGCNLACHFCYGVIQARDGFFGVGKKNKPNPKLIIDGQEMGFVGRDRLVHMPEEVIKGVFSDSKDIGVRSIALIGEGENTLNKALYPSIEYARDIQFDVSMATHGANIKEQHVESLMTSLQWLRINISAATPESYDLVHQRPWFDKVMRATELLLEGREKNGYRNWRGEKTAVGFQMVLTKRNFDDVVKLARLGREMGVDYTVIKACSDTPDRELDAPDQEYLDMVEIFKEAESYSTDNGLRSETEDGHSVVNNDAYSVIVRWNKLGNMGNKEYGVCHGTRFIIAISGDGTVFPCGHWFARERERFAMGNVNDMSFADIVKSKTYWDAQEEIHKVDLRNCETNCRQHGCNQTLSQIAESNDPGRLLQQMEADKPASKPVHVNFV